MQPAFTFHVQDQLGRPLTLRRFTSYVVYIAVAMVIMAGEGWIPDDPGHPDGSDG